VDVNVLIRELEKFKKISSEVQVATILTLHYIGRRGICIQKDIERELGLSNASASRNINYWTRTGNRGLDFIERFEDPDDRRHNRLRLTDDGRAFFDRIRGR
jgi:DNA-binding MarR family transcriptional regulator